MKRSTLILCFVPVIGLLFTSSSVEAISSEKAMKKGKFVSYTGQQQDWPRSDKRVAPVEVAKDGILIYDQLPDRPYEVLGTVFASDDLLLKHASQAAVAAGGVVVATAPATASVDSAISQFSPAGNRPA